MPPARPARRGLALSPSPLAAPGLPAPSVDADDYEDLASSAGIDPLAQTYDSPPFGEPPASDADLFAPGPPSALAFQGSADSSGAVLSKLLTDPALRRKRWIIIGAASGGLVVLFLIVFVLALPGGDDDSGAATPSASAGASVEGAATGTGDAVGDGTHPTMSAAAGAFVIEDAPVPEAVQKMSKLRRHRRALRQRRLASRLHARRRYERAETWWRRSLVFYPQSGENAAGLARTLAAQDKTAEALAWARRGVEESPESSMAREVLGDLLLAGGDVDAAIAEYEAGLAQHPRSRRLSTRLRRARAQR